MPCVRFRRFAQNCTPFEMTRYNVFYQMNISTSKHGLMSFRAFLKARNLAFSLTIKDSIKDFVASLKIALRYAPFEMTWHNVFYQMNISIPKHGQLSFRAFLKARNPVFSLTIKDSIKDFSLNFVSFEMT